VSPFEVGNIAKRDTLGITIKYASPKVAALLAFCFNGFMTHGMLPDSMLAVILVPVIKDKAGKVGSMENYRPIALASVLSKVLERILLDRLSEYIDTTDNQFGFKGTLRLFGTLAYSPYPPELDKSIHLFHLRACYKYV